MNIKKIAVLLIIFVGITFVSRSAEASSVSERYLIKSTSSIARRTIGNVRNDFVTSFSSDLTPFELRMAKMLKLDVEKVQALHISGRLESLPKFAINNSVTGIPIIAVLDTSDGAEDRNGHGVMIERIIRSVVGDDVRISMYNVCNDQGICYADDVAVAIRKSVDDGVRVINMSFGGEHEDDLINDALIYAYKRGVLLIAAAGNGGPYFDSVEYPASSDMVVSVGALVTGGRIADWSSRGDVDVWEFGEFENLAGTSVSSALFAARSTWALTNDQ